MGCCGTPRLRLDVDPGDLEVVRRIQRTGPAPDGIQRAKLGKHVPLQYDQFADQSPLLVIPEALVAATLEKPVPPPSPREEPLHGLFFGLRQRRGVDDVSTEADKDVSLLGVRQPDDDPLVRSTVCELRLDPQAAESRQAP